MKDSFKEQYTYYRLGKFYFWFVTHYEIAMTLARPLLKVRKQLGPLKILDAGCGPGNLINHLNTWGEVIGIDSSKDALLLCREKHTNHTYQASLDNIPFPDETFDFIFSLDTIEHIDDDLGAIKELHRILKPGGTLVATVPAFMCLWGHHDEKYGHLRRYRKYDFRQLAIGGGFKVIRCCYFKSLLFLPLWIMRRFKTILNIKSDDFYQFNPIINKLFLTLLKMEIPIASTINLPFGTSLLAILTK